jgi:hypothetical protein
MSKQAPAGTVIGASATLPTTYDSDGSSGYPSLTFTAIGEITDIPSFGPTRAVVTHSPLASIDIDKKLGSRDNGSLTLTMALDDDDAGQAILEAAVASGDAIAFEIQLPDGSEKYFTGVVSSFQNGVGTIDGEFIQATSQIEITKPFVTVAA